MTSPLFTYLRDNDEFTVWRWQPDLLGDGYPARGDYVETCWLPLLGPSATVIARRLALTLRDVSEATVDLGVLGAECGLGKDRPRVALDRLGRFGLVTLAPRGVGVRTVFPPVPLGSIRKLPEHLRQRAAA